MMWLWTAHRTAYDYSMGSDWDNRWRTGGAGPEVIAEAKIDAQSLLEGIQRFVSEKIQRFEKITAGAKESAEV